MLNRSMLLAAALATAAVGCVPPRNVGRVEIVPTHTPGLAFVIVRPSVKRGDAAATAGGTVTRQSEYILFCDGRAVDGMRCTLANEVALQRLSHHPSNKPAPHPVAHPVGSLVDGVKVETSEIRGPDEVPPVPQPGVTPTEGTP